MKRSARGHTLKLYCAGSNTSRGGASGGGHADAGVRRERDQVGEGPRERGGLLGGAHRSDTRLGRGGSLACVWRAEAQAAQAQGPRRRGGADQGSGLGCAGGGASARGVGLAPTRSWRLRTPPPISFPFPRLLSVIFLVSCLRRKKGRL